MSQIPKVGLLSAMCAAAMLDLMPPASAAPNDPCAMPFMPICAVLPVLPDLDHDTDLTTGPGPLTDVAGDDGPAAGVASEGGESDR